MKDGQPPVWADGYGFDEHGPYAEIYCDPGASEEAVRMRWTPVNNMGGLALRPAAVWWSERRIDGDARFMFAPAYVKAKAPSAAYVFDPGTDPAVQLIRRFMEAPE